VPSALTVIASIWSNWMRWRSRQSSCRVAATPIGRRHGSARAERFGFHAVSRAREQEERDQRLAKKAHEQARAAAAFRHSRCGRKKAAVQAAIERAQRRRTVRDK